MVIVLSFLSLIVGILVGWFAADKYTAYMENEAHEFDELFDKNPHPELFDENGKLNKNEYITMIFDPGFDPELWDPETDIEIEE